MLSPPSTRPSGSRGRASSAFAREDSGNRAVPRVSTTSAASPVRSWSATSGRLSSAAEIGSSADSTASAVRAQAGWRGCRSHQPLFSAPRPRSRAMKRYVPNVKEEVRFCTAPDGIRLAYAVHGRGPPLVRVATWLTHLDTDWESPVWRHWLAALGERHTVVRYDERGCGLSDSAAGDLSLDTWMADLETVVDAGSLHVGRHVTGSGGGCRLCGRPSRAGHRPRPVWRLRARRPL